MPEVAASYGKLLDFMAFLYCITPNKYTKEQNKEPNNVIIYKLQKKAKTQIK